MKSVVRVMAVSGITIFLTASLQAEVTARPAAQSAASKAEQAETLHQQGHAFHGAKQWEKSIAAFRASLKLQPNSVEVRNDLADVLAAYGDAKWNTKKYDDAWALYKQANAAYKTSIALDPKNARARYNYGIFLINQAWSEQQRDSPHATVKALADASIAQVRKALEIHPENEDYRHQLAKCLDFIGYKRLARLEYEKLVSSSDAAIAKDSRATLEKYKAEERKAQQAHQAALHAASKKLLSEGIATNRLSARDLLFIHQFKSSGAMTLQTEADDAMRTLKPTPEREKLLRLLAPSFAALDKSKIKESDLRPGDVIIEAGVAQTEGTIAVVQSPVKKDGQALNDVPPLESYIDLLLFDETKRSAGIVKARQSPSQIFSTPSRVLLRPLDSKFLALLTPKPR